jgi:hypothetical protein
MKCHGQLQTFKLVMERPVTFQSVRNVSQFWGLKCCHTFCILLEGDTYPAMAGFCTICYNSFAWCKQFICSFETLILQVSVEVCQDNNSFKELFSTDWIKHAGYSPVFESFRYGLHLVFVYIVLQNVPMSACEKMWDPWQGNCAVNSSTTSHHPHKLSWQ